MMGKYLYLLALPLSSNEGTCYWLSPSARAPGQTDLIQESIMDSGKQTCIYTEKEIILV